MSLITSSPTAALAQAQPQVHFDLSHILVVIESSFPSEGDAYGFEGYCRANGAVVWMIKTDGRLIDQYRRESSKELADLIVAHGQQIWLVSGRKAASLPYIVQQPYNSRQRFPANTEGRFVTSYGEVIGMANEPIRDPVDPVLVSADFVLSLRGGPALWPKVPQGQFLHNVTPFTLEEARLEEYAWALNEHFKSWGPTLQADGTYKLVWPMGSEWSKVRGVKGFMRTMRRDNTRNWPTQEKVWRERKDFFEAWHPYLRQLRTQHRNPTA